MERRLLRTMLPLAFVVACGPSAQGFHSLATPSTMVWDSTLVGEWIYELDHRSGAGIIGISEGESAEYDVYMYDRKASHKLSAALVQLGSERYVDLEGPGSRTGDEEGNPAPIHAYYRFVSVVGDTMRLATLDGWPKSWRLGPADSLTPGSNPTRTKSGWSEGAASSDNVQLTLRTPRLQVEIPRAFHAADAKLDTFVLLRLRVPDGMVVSH
jgi:hypothetical protein